MENKYNEAKKIVEKYKDDICDENGKISIFREKTKEFYRILFDNNSAAAVYCAVVNKHVRVGCQQWGVCSFDNAAVKAHDVVCQYHVVNHYIVQNVDSAVKHVETVAKVTQCVVAACHVVFCVQIQIFVLVCFFVVNFNVFYAVFASWAASPYAFIVFLNCGWDRAVKSRGKSGREGISKEVSYLRVNDSSLVK